MNRALYIPLAALLGGAPILEACSSRIVTRVHLDDEFWESEKTGFGSYVKGPDLSILVRLSLHEQRRANARHMPPLAISFYFNTTVSGFEFDPREVELIVNNQSHTPTGIRAVLSGDQSRSAGWDCGAYRDIEIKGTRLDIRRGICVELYFDQLAAIPAQEDMRINMRGLSRESRNVVVPTMLFIEAPRACGSFYKMPTVGRQRMRSDVCH